jgi:hypothetical protein
MKKIRLKLEASEDYIYRSVSIESLGFTEEEFDALSEADQKLELQKYANDLPEQPYWYVAKFEDDNF